MHIPPPPHAQVPAMQIKMRLPDDLILPDPAKARIGWFDQVCLFSSRTASRIGT